MKYQFNIFAFIVAIVVFFATSGVGIFEHVCNSSSSRNFSLLKKTICKMEEPSAACCKKIGLKKKDDCCEHKFLFAKLKTEFTFEKNITEQHTEYLVINHGIAFLNSIPNKIILERYYSGLSPPDNFFFIKFFLRPTPVELQTFRC